ncbi:hypothetical protein CPB83DRAFT_853927 [Crepidotus variabilis]|uniref:Uncharacterized protein n=1 Tax=Crepidotus variabilis TaxID=179855 RepID=A0A9P6EGG3_9AGAR|nr:hypothetical protein CPB83DRAFT_853927 [Crepidotus variabilis]
MPRQSRGRASAPAPRAAPAPAQSRSAHTASAPAGNYAQPHAPAPPAGATSHAQPSQGPGMLGQMAATAGSVAIGSTIGHGLSSMLFGGSSSAQEAPVQQATPVQQQNGMGIQCEAQAKDFTKCLDKADFQSCSWYLEQLKACQSAANSFTSS